MAWDIPLTLLLFLLRLLLLFLLYGFLLLVAWLVWQELKQGSQSPAAAPTRNRGRSLVVVGAGESGYAEGLVFTLQAVNTVGRDLSNDIVIPDSYASSRHARIERQADGRYWIVDLGSSNGTLLNKQLLRPHDPVPLDRGDVVGIGTVEMKVA